MIEQKIEKIVMDKISAALDGKGIQSKQIIGAWQMASPDEVKALEEKDAENFITVKVMPRQYETPTVPYAQFLVYLTVLTRAELDKDGANWFNATEVVQGLLQRWQSSFSAMETDFSVTDEFTPSGFSMSGGDIGLDKEKCTWIFTQTFDLYGVIQQ